MKTQLSVSLVVFFSGIAAYILDYVEFIVVLELFLSLYIVWFDFSKGIKQTTFLTYYSLFAILYIVGNFMVVYSQDTELEPLYNYYLSKPHVMNAVMISFVGHVSFAISYLMFDKRLTNFEFNGEVPDRILLPIVIAGIFYSAQSVFTGLSIEIIDMFLFPFLFLFVKSAVKKDKPVLINFAILLVVLMVIKALLFSYRR
jgi:hypothetical protein